VHPKVGKLRMGMAEVEFAWLAKQDSAGAVFPFRKLCNKKHCKRKSSYYAAE